MKLKLPKDTVEKINNNEDLEKYSHSTVKKFFGGIEFSQFIPENKEFFENFVKIAHVVDLPSLVDFFGLYSALALKGKSSEEMNEFLGLEDDLSQKEKAGLEELYSELDI